MKPVYEAVAWTISSNLIARARSLSTSSKILQLEIGNQDKRNKVNTYITLIASVNYPT